MSAMQLPDGAVVSRSPAVKAPIWSEIELQTPTGAKLGGEATLAAGRYSPPPQIPEDATCYAAASSPTSFQLPLNPFDDQMDHQSTTTINIKPESQPTVEMSPTSWKKLLKWRGQQSGSPVEHYGAGQNQGAEIKPWVSSFLHLILLKIHPLQLTLLIRVTLIYPLLFYFLFSAIKADDWKHIDIQYEANGLLKSRTMLSLRSVQRVTETTTNQLSTAAAASVRELPISYHSLYNDNTGFCNAEAQTQTALALLGADTPLTQTVQNSNSRVTKLALYHLFYGPTFRDVDCAQLKAFQRGGQITFSLLTLAIAFALTEYLILLMHLMSSSRAAESRNALTWSLLRQKRRKQGAEIRPPMAIPHRRVETDPVISHNHAYQARELTGSREPGQTTTVPSTSRRLPECNSPPFLCPRLPATVTAPPELAPLGRRCPPDRDLSWALIDLSGRHAEESIPRRPPTLRVLKVKVKRLKEKLSRQNSLSAPKASDTAGPESSREGFRAAAPRPRVFVLGDNQGTKQGWRLSDWLWWMPLGYFQRCVGWTDGAGNDSFFCASFMAGSTFLLSCLTALAIGVGLLTWWRKTSAPACLNETTQVQVCNSGWGSRAAFVSAAITTGCIYFHLKTPFLCDRIDTRRRTFEDTPRI